MHHQTTRNNSFTGAKPDIYENPIYPTGERAASTVSRMKNYCDEVSQNDLTWIEQTISCPDELSSRLRHRNGILTLPLLTRLTRMNSGGHMGDDRSPSSGDSVRSASIRCVPAVPLNHILLNDIVLPAHLLKSERHSRAVFQCQSPSHPRPARVAVNNMCCNPRRAPRL